MIEQVARRFDAGGVPQVLTPRLRCQLLVDGLGQDRHERVTLYGGPDGRQLTRESAGVRVSLEEPLEQASAAQLCRYGDGLGETSLPIQRESEHRPGEIRVVQAPLAPHLDRVRARFPQELGGDSLRDHRGLQQGSLALALAGEQRRAGHEPSVAL